MLLLPRVKVTKLVIETGEAVVRDQYFLMEILTVNAPQEDQTFFNFIFLFDLPVSFGGNVQRLPKTHAFVVKGFDDENYPSPPPHIDLGPVGPVFAIV